jgi:1-deoxy-D-xylulose-5-phosphate synthase
VEDGTVVGGFGSAILEFLNLHGYRHIQVRMLGIPDEFVEHGKPEELYRDCGYDAAAIAEAVREMSGVEVV